MSDLGPIDAPLPDDDDRRRRRGGWIFDRWGIPLTVIAALVVVLAVGAGAWALGSNGDDGDEVLVEAADSVGPFPFTTAGIVSTSDASSSTGPRGSTTALYGGSGDIGVCAPEQLVAFLETHPDKAKAWVAGLNASSTLVWSGGTQLTVGDIAAYVAELTPTHLTKDTRVTNNGFEKGKPTPRQSLLKKGTAVLVDKNGVPRVRCKCGNPLDDPDGGGGTTTTIEVTTTTIEVTTTTEPHIIENRTTTTSPGGTTTTRKEPSTTAGPVGTQSTAEVTTTTASKGSPAPTRL